VDIRLIMFQIEFLVPNICVASIFKKRHYPKPVTMMKHTFQVRYSRAISGMVLFSAPLLPEALKVKRQQTQVYVKSLVRTDCLRSEDPDNIMDVHGKISTKDLAVQNSRK